MSDVNQTTPGPARSELPEMGEVPASTGGVVDLDRIIGNIPVVVVLLEELDDPATELLRSLGEHLVEFGRYRIQVLAATPMERDRLVVADHLTAGNVRILADPDRSIAARLGAAYRSGRAVVVLAGSDGRLAATWDDQPDGTFAERLLTELAHLLDHDDLTDDLTVDAAHASR